MWFTERVDPRIGRITMTGSISEHLLPNGAGSYAQPLGIAKGPDGNVWLSDFFQQVGRVNVEVWDQALGPAPMPPRQAAPPTAPSGAWRQRQ
jgi:virginiamycin B lyase